MLSIKTKISIEATPQTVWSIMDDLAQYPEWNQLTPDLAGRTTVGSVVRGILVKEGAPRVPISPTLTAIIGAREFRWLTDAPGFRAEHYFLLIPAVDGGTELSHCEDFDGPLAIERRAGIEATSPPAFDLMNRDLKARAERLATAAVPLHPAVDGPIAPVATQAVEITLACRCDTDRVIVALTGSIYHNHLCGCSKCWKPKGALFAQTAVVARNTLEVREQSGKLVVVDPSQSIRRHACEVCGTHMYGDVADVDHHFYGLCFVHPELGATASKVEFAGFVSSLIESGTSPSMMEAIRARLAGLSIPASDAFSPELMDLIAWHRRKIVLMPQSTE